MRVRSTAVVMSGLIGSIFVAASCADQNGPSDPIGMEDFASTAAAAKGGVAKPPSITKVDLSSRNLTLGGPATDYTAAINSSSPATDIYVRGEVTQGSVTHATGGTIVNCTATPGLLPKGKCAVQWGAVATNANESGVLVPGPATFTVIVEQRDGAISTTQDSKSIPVTIVAGSGASIGNWVLFSTEAELEGPAVDYNITLWNNVGSSISLISINAQIEQGSAVRNAGGTIAFCPDYDGVLPPGSCTMQFVFVASNITAGVGTLTAGPATLVVTVTRIVGSVTTVLDTRSQPITITETGT